MNWVLIIYAMGIGGYGPVTPVVYPTLAACQAAGDDFMHRVGAHPFVFEGRTVPAGGYLCAVPS
jgi:hypothetical protein